MVIMMLKVLSIQLISLFWLQKPFRVAVEVEEQQLHLGSLLVEVEEFRHKNSIEVR